MEKIRKCKYCGNDNPTKLGMRNWKNLFKKPTLEDYITLFIIVMVIISAYAYQIDISNLRNYYESSNYCSNQVSLSGVDNGDPQITIQDLSDVPNLANHDGS